MTAPDALLPVILPNGTSAYQHPALAGISHGFFTSKGGTSKGVYSSLNTGPGSQDDPALVDENRARAARGLNLAPATLCGLYQYHSAEIMTYTADHPPHERPKADGLVTNLPDLTLAILTADCAPIFFIDHKAAIIGACHAGWRGAVSGVIENTVQAMCTLGARADNIRMIIGPTIAQPSYQVGTDMRNEALASAAGDRATACFSPDNKEPGKWFFDLPAFCSLAGQSAGLTQIYDTGIDTYISDTLCFSHRRATHQGLSETGRLISLISLSPPQTK